MREINFNIDTHFSEENIARREEVRKQRERARRRRKILRWSVVILTLMTVWCGLGFLLGYFGGIEIDGAEVFGVDAGLRVALIAFAVPALPFALAAGAIMLCTWASRA